MYNSQTTPNKINTDASASLKGYELQKLRAAKRILQALEEDKKAIYVAIEHIDDVLEGSLDGDNASIITEQDKSYSESARFSFVSEQVLNSVRIFFDNWKAVESSDSISFVFYTNAEIAKERMRDEWKEAGLVKPEKSLIELLCDGDYQIALPYILPVFKKYYIEQHKKHVAKPEDIRIYENILTNMSDDDWISFFKKIEWQFGQVDANDLREELKETIASLCRKYRVDSTFAEMIRASILDAIGTASYQIDFLKKIVHVAEIENFFLRLSRYEGTTDDLKVKIEERERFYKDIIESFEAQEKETIIGNEPLATAYIEPWTNVEVREDNQVEIIQCKMLDQVEDWFDQTQYGVLLLHGQPGDGKTTFCRKAVYEYAKRRRLLNADGVYTFTLNQAESHIIDDRDVDIESAFHRPRSKENLFSLKECRDKKMLIFLDGYDEVKMLLNNTQYSDFGKFFDYIQEQAKEFKVHFVITTRTVAVEEELDAYKDHAFEFLPLSYEQQESWVKDGKRARCLVYDQSKTYEEYWNSKLENVCAKEPKGKTAKSFYQLLQIPFIFRMVIHQGYDFSDAVRNQAKLYEDLFVKTLSRRPINGIVTTDMLGKPEEVVEELKQTYMDIAYKIWCHNDSMTPYNGNLRDLLLFSYFMTGIEKETDSKKEEEQSESEDEIIENTQKSMIGFIHRSIYQYFLALYIYTKIENIAYKKKAEAESLASDYLAGLGSRLLEKDVLLLLSQIVSNRIEENKNKCREKMKASCGTIFKKLAKEEGIFKPHQKILKLETRILRQKERNGNIFNNAINTCFCFDVVDEFNKCEGLKKLFEENKTMRLYMSGAKKQTIDLSGLNLSGSDMEGSILSYVDFSGARMDRCNLKYTEMTGSAFVLADLSHSDLEKACLDKTHMIDAFASDTNLKRAEINDANLMGCSLRRSNLMFAELKGTKLKGAAFTDAVLLETTPSANELFDNPNSKIPWTDFKGYIEGDYDREKYKVGELFPEPFGKYPQEDKNDFGNKSPIQWRILEIRGNRALLLSEKILDVQPYNKEYTDTNWKECSLRFWLNNDFLERAEFTKEEKAQICTTLCEPHENINKDYGTYQGLATFDQFFLLSGQELVRYFADAKSEKRFNLVRSKTKAEGTKLAKRENGLFVNRKLGTSWWWLRSVGSSGSLAVYVDYDGVVYAGGGLVLDGYVGVRPALWITLKS